MMRKVRKVKAKAANGHQLAEALPAGLILTDLYKQQWILGKSIGVGGFGEIYSASKDVSKPVTATANYVIKVEPHTNGPLFTEIHVYLNIAKTESIEKWKQERRLKFLGMPKFIGSGSHEYNETKYRFMVMERFGNDLQKIFIQNGRLFTHKTVLNLGIKILDVLEYIHSLGYVHCDIKASNLLLGHTDKSNEKVYLVDFGLACRYLTKESDHKPFKPDPKKAHDGTIEYTSRDAHIGLFSRRGDLEILAYNMLQWTCGKLPWEKDLENCEGIKTQKLKYFEDVPRLFADCYKKSNPCPGLKELFDYIVKLKFEEDPDYDLCRQFFKNGLKQSGFKYDGKLDFKQPVIVTPKSKKETIRTRQKIETENLTSSPIRTTRSSSRKPCALAQSNRVKKLSPEIKVQKSTSPPAISNPTPAMLIIMEKKRLKEELKAKKAKAAKRPSPQTRAAKRPSPQSNTGRSKRVKQNNEISPDLF